jgi:Na+-driven multidrug efflux pump
MNKNRDLDLTTQPIQKLIKKLAIPASIGYFFNTMYNVVDTFFGGMISTQVLAALSLSLPIFSSSSRLERAFLRVPRH